MPPRASSPPFQGGTISSEIDWTSGLGAVTHLGGPIDQVLKLAGGQSAAGVGQGITLAGGLGATAADAGGPITLQTAAAGTGTTLTTRLTILATGAAQYAGLTADPVASAANTGNLIYNSTTQTFRVSLNGAAYTDLDTTAGDSLQTAYVAGPTIATTIAQGPVTIGNAVDTQTALQVNRTFVGVGTAIGVTMAAGATGAALNLVPGTGGFIRFGTADPFARNQIWHTGINSIFRMGADTADGDPADIDSEGIVVYHPTGDQLGRMKADRFALTRATDSSLNYFRVDQTSLFYRANPPGGAVHFFVDRTTGFVGVGTATPTKNLDVVGDLKVSGAIDPTSISFTGAAASIFINSVTSTAAASVAGEGRIRFVTGTGFQISSDGGAYATISTGAGTSPFVASGTDILTTSATYDTLILNDATTSAAVTRTIKAPNGNAATVAGSALTLSGGSGNTSGAGGTLLLQGGSGGSSGNGGPLLLLSGSGGATGGNSGSFAISTGATGDGNTGTLTISCANATGTNRNAGQLTLQGGNGTGSGSGSSLQLSSGRGGATGLAGVVSITTGIGGTTSGASGAMTLATGTTTDGNTGLISLTTAAPLGTNRNSGAITLLTGNTADGQTGGINLTTGTASGTNRASGSITISCGTATGTAAGGNISIQAGATVTGTSGAVTLDGGYCNTVGTGGVINITSGQGGNTSGTSGGINIGSGSVADGDTGDVIVHTRTAATTTAANRNTGTITIQTGSPTNAGTAGSILLKTNTVTRLTLADAMATFSGNVTVSGKLTVTGAIDPPSLSLSGGTALYFESNDGSTAAVAPLNKGRIRYLDGTGWQVSSSTGAYATIATGATTSPFTASGTNILTTSATYDTLILNDATTSAAVNRTVKAPDGTASVNGSHLFLRAGAGGATSGNGGSNNLIGGSSSDGDTGTVNIESPSAAGTNRNTGGIALSTGTPTGTGTAGSITLATNSVTRLTLTDAMATFSGNVTVSGKLTVTGAIDPPSLSLSGGTALYFESNDGSTAAVAPLNKGRIRYLDGTGWQVSSSTGAYATLSTGTPTLSTVLAAGNTTGANNVVVSAGQKIVSAAASALTLDGTTTLDLQTGATTRWQVSATGHLLPGTTDNAEDIGASATNRIRTLYAGTSVVVGATVTINGTTNAITSSANLTLDTAAAGTLNLGNANATTIVFGSGATTLTASGNVTVTGDLTVNGTTTTVNSVNLTVTDPLIYANNGGLDPSFAGFAWDQGAALDVILSWNPTNNRFEFGRFNTVGGTVLPGGALTTLTTVRANDLLLAGTAITADAGLTVTSTAATLALAATGANAITFATAGTGRARFTSAGNLTFDTDATNDVGAVGANRPNNVYVANSVVVGSSVTIGTASVTGSGALTVTATAAPLALAATGANAITFATAATTRMQVTSTGGLQLENGAGAAVSSTVTNSALRSNAGVLEVSNGGAAYVAVATGTTSPFTGTEPVLATSASTRTLYLSSASSIAGTNTYRLRAPDSSSAAGHGLTLQSGAPASGSAGGDILLRGADGVAGNSSGGSVTWQPGIGTGSAGGGSFAGQSGAGGDTGNGGSVLIYTGVGGGTSGASGPMDLATGTTTDGNTGAISVTTGTPLGTNRNSGGITLETGTPTGTGTSGSILLKTGNTTRLTLADAMATFSGDVTVSGKLTVTGAIDPPSLSLSGGTALFVDSADGSTAPVSAAGHGRMRFVAGTGWQFDNAGAGYSTVTTTASQVWTRSGVTLSPTTAGDVVTISHTAADAVAGLAITMGASTTGAALSLTQSGSGNHISLGTFMGVVGSNSGSAASAVRFTAIASSRTSAVIVLPNGTGAAVETPYTTQAILSLSANSSETATFKLAATSSDYVFETFKAGAGTFRDFVFRTYNNDTDIGVENLRSLTDGGLRLSNGSTAAVSAASTSALRSNAGTLEVSNSTGAYAAIRSGTVAATVGGTGQTVYAVGDILYASTTTALSKLAVGTVGQVLTVAAGLPSWATSATSPFTASGTNILTTSATYDTLILNDATTSAVVTRTIKAPNGTASVAGSNLFLDAGDGGTTSGNGGLVSIRGGSATQGNGGSANVLGRDGVGTNRNGGNVVLDCGEATGTGEGGTVSITAGGGGTTGIAGTVAITGGTGGSTSGSSGGVSIASGTTTDGNTGQISVTTGTPLGTNRNSGAIAIQTGTPTGTGTSGSILLKTNLVTRLTLADAMATFSGNVTVSGKLTVTGAIDPPSLSLSGGTALYLESADGSTAGTAPVNQGRIRYLDGTGWQVSSSTGAYATISTGSSPFVASGTNVLTTSSTYDTLILNDATTSAAVSRTIKAPGGTATANGSSLFIQGGAGGSSSGSGGGLFLVGGTPTSGNGGSVSAVGGASTSTLTAGSVSLSGGTATGNGGTAGSVAIFGGNANGATGTAGNITLTGGSQSTAGVGGAITLTGGAGGSVSGSSGGVSIASGTTTDGNSGAISVTTATPLGTNRSSGAITLETGTPTGTGTSGSILLKTNLVTRLTLADAMATFSGNVTVSGKLTVTGAIDPPSLSLSGGTALYFESNDGSTAAVAPLNKGRIRYLDGTGWQVSSSTGAYATIATGATTSPFVASGTNVLTTSSTYDTLILNDATTSAAVTRTIKAPDGTATAAGSNLTVVSGSGGTTSGASGALIIKTGATTDGTTGLLTILTSTPLGTNRSSGQVSISTGIATGSGSSGLIQLSVGAAGTTGIGGLISLVSGAGGSTSGNGGAIDIYTGGAVLGTSGALTLATGTTTDGNTGAVSLRSGDASGTARTSGSLAIATGAGGSVSGGSNALTLATGTTTDGDTGAISLTTPTPLGTNRSSGNITHATGTPTGTGTAGTHQFTVAGASQVKIGTTGITSYRNVTTAGWGVPAIYGSGRSTAQTAAVASVATYTVGAADGSFDVSANVNVTTSTTHSFTVTVAYTDETNTGQTLTLTFSSLAGTLITTITNVTGVGPYSAPALRIRCKASTSITVATAGTFTSVTYNAEATITQVS